MPVINISENPRGLLSPQRGAGSGAANGNVRFPKTALWGGLEWRTHAPQTDRVSAQVSGRGLLGSFMKYGKNQIWGLRWSASPFLPTIQKSGKAHKLRTYILIQKTRKLERSFFENQNVFMFMTFRASGNVNDLLKPLFLTWDPPNDQNNSRNPRIIFRFLCIEKSTWFGKKNVCRGTIEIGLSNSWKS